MIAVGLALASAAAYGLSDFLGGLASKRASAWTVGIAGQLAGALLVALLGVTLVTGDPTRADLAWGLLAGLGNGFGVAFLYRGLASGRMGVVAPVSGVAAAVVPVVVGLASGERPGVLVLLGMLAAVPAIWLVASEPGADPHSVPDAASPADGLRDGLLAGLGFGLLFAAIAQVPDAAGALPLAASQTGGALTLGLLAAASGGLGSAALAGARRGAALGALTGLLGALAVLLFLTATHHGYLTVVAVIAALYPAGTVLLAAGVLREPIHRLQGLGLALCGLAVALVAAG
ncbi:EamA family transporter [Nocardioides sp. TRM66260-LWL]|uniref:EamA family transporter n=1 Tax=Nocardioides sp. TRM66260-LWL TaxID=2874478 RepID=UPI001CC6703B|nr:EamA family transporter [Nocardioides sp. TRM66260-LWL]MBZ5733719.1 EamA family transporter [Nocardioides sp. TRM66260-LWL]